MKKLFALQLVILLFLLLGLTGCSSILAPVQSILSDQPANNLPAAIQVLTAPESSPAAGPALSQNETLAAIETALADIYDRVNPSVVSIRVAQKTSQAELPTLPDLPGFRFFFGQPGWPGFPQQEPQQPEPKDFYRYGAGSGFVWDKEGHIVTNNHVVEGADKITVSFADGTTATATIVGADPDSDLAVIKVDLPANQLQQLQPVTLGDSNQLKVGQLAVAIGNPFGLENTMTVGFVSALGRVLPVNSDQGEGILAAPRPSFTIPDIIQTDAPINPGNSGGVLVNDQGQVIGVTAAIESPVRASAGIGFAIPSAIVQRVVPALIKDGLYQHTWLGVSGVSLNPELAQAMDLPADQRGALVMDVTPGSPADKAGLQGSDRQVKIEDQEVRVGGDVIVAIDGQPVKEFDDLVSYLTRATDVNQQVTLTVLRRGQEETVQATLAARPTVESAARQPEQVAGNGPRLGIKGVTLTPELAQAMGLPAEQQGVLVQRIEVGSPADQADLNGSFKSALINGQEIPVGGDVIVAVDNQPVTKMEELQQYIRQAKVDQVVKLTVLRDGQQMNIPVTLKESAEPTS
jgi:serine protease Do